MIYRAIQLIQIFLADGRTDGRTKVIQEVLADLKIMFTVSAEGSEVEAKGRMQLATLLHSINLQAAKTGIKR